MARVILDRRSPRPRVPALVLLAVAATGALAACSPVGPPATPASITPGPTLPPAGPTSDGAAIKGYAAGVPALLKALPAGCAVLVSSADNEARDKINASVSLGCSSQAGDIQAHYRRLAAQHGYKEASAGAKGATPGAASDAASAGAQSITFAKASTGEYFTVTLVNAPAAGAGMSVTAYGSFVPDMG